MKEKKQLLDALRNLKVQTNSLACLGCGWVRPMPKRRLTVLKRSMNSM